MARVSVALVLVLAMSACTHALSPSPTRPFSIGSETASGLALVSPRCSESDGEVSARGTVTSDGPALGTAVEVTLTALDNQGGQHARSVDYPTPQAAGTPVPFSLLVAVGADSAYTCNIQLAWLGAPAQQT